MRLQCSSTPQTRIKELVRGYFHQLTVGCEGCSTAECRGNPDFLPQDAEAAFARAKELARLGMAPERTYHFCLRLNYPVGALHLDVEMLSTSLVEERFTQGRLNTVVSKTLSNPVCVQHCWAQDAADDASSGLDLGDLRRTFDFLQREAKATTLQALQQLVGTLRDTRPTRPCQLRPFHVVMEWPLLGESETYGDLLPPLLEAICSLQPPMRRTLVSWWARLDADILQRLTTGVLGKFIEVQWAIVQLAENSRSMDTLAHATIVMGFLSQANQLSESLRGEATIDYKLFYNDVVNNMIDTKRDYHAYRKGRRDRASPESGRSFAFTYYPFIMDPATKAEILSHDAAAQQHDQVTSTFFSMMLSGGTAEALYCLLRISRANLIASALAEVTNKLDDLKKPLKVKFMGEDGVDEGGVQKEFFQLVCKELFDPQYGMFTYNEDRNIHWFNPNSFENTDEYRLIGIVFGLAIYNSVILETRFPLGIYKKLLGRRTTLHDLKGFDEELYKGFCALLAFQESDDSTVEDIYCRSFTVESEVYGATVHVPLKENGADIPLTKDNREEYVDLYVKYVLNDSIQRQFDAFNSGFQDVVGGEILKIFRPEELELLICGSPDLDFHSLEEQCRYEGFSKDDRVIKDFWSCVHDLTEGDRKRLLQFATGSDRVPIRGLGSINFLIQRNGGDSDMLPTSHTCFNHLLLPEYSTKEKLQEKLLTAINNCTGFGLQ